MTDLAEDLEAFFKVLEASESPEVDRLRAIVSRHEADPRYAPIKSVFERIQTEVQSGDWTAAQELAIVMFNVAWERSEEYHVGRDAFLRRIRGRNFKPLSYANPLISDRGAALTTIMQGDQAALESIARQPGSARELVIELTGDFDIVRLTKD